MEGHSIYQVDGFVNSGSDLYDYAPGVLLIREAGGVAVNFEGDDWSIKDTTLVAGNERLVEQILIHLKR